MQNIAKYLSPEIITIMKAEISNASGNEVFFIGYCDESQYTVSVDVVARGDDEMVPAVLKRAEEADVVIHNHPDGPLKPSKADLSIASYLEKFSVAFYIINNDVNDIYVVIEPFKKEVITPLDHDKIASILAPGGLVSRFLKGYESRPQQLEMVKNICKAFNDQKIASVEAGTGTGKSLAYLLPAIFWSLQNKERVVVSTNTINLQEQLIKKDIPFLKKVLPQKFEAVLVKGRGNYVCLRKVQELETEFDLLTDEEERDELHNLIEWAKNSSDGSKADLAYIPDTNIWDKLASESETCTRIKCPFYRKCFINKARRKASRANILVVNHHLFFADLAIKTQMGHTGAAAVLPPYQRIIFDEAHHIEDVASNYLGSRVTKAGIFRILHRIYRRKKNTAKGQLPLLLFKLSSKQRMIADRVYQKLRQLLSSELPSELDSLLAMNSNVMDFVYQWVRERSQQTTGEIKIRLTEEIRNDLINEYGFNEILKEFVASLKNYSVKLGSLLRLIQQAEADAKVDWSSPMIEIVAQAERLSILANTIEEILFQSDEKNVKWIEIKEGYRGNNIVRFLSSPLEVGEMMNEYVYEQFPTVIFTSATLTVEESFQFLGQRIGLDLVSSDRNSELVLSSPFNFLTQAVVGIPTDIPDPRHADFVNELSNMVFKSITISEGKTFVLFTSYGLLNLVFKQISESLNILGLATLKQGTENRQMLLERFRNDKTSVLFGTDSFWEGVDVEGDALESVIITKLPFRVPSEPLIEARVETIEKRGGNAFMQYAVPLAVLKFKQGFGRLIRKTTDRGCVLIFDKRVVEKSYGRIFLNSLPKCNIIIDKSQTVFEGLKLFFNG